MKRNFKGMLSIIVITILALSFALPFVSVYATVGTPELSSYTVQVGDVITVSGGNGNVTGGATVKAWWDYAVGPDALLLNTTMGAPLGSYEMEVEIPAAVNGTIHAIYIDDGGTPMMSAPITVLRKVVVDPDEGLHTDEVTVEGSGFDAELDITIIFENTTGTIYSKVMVTSPTTVETDEYGSFTCTFDIPDVDYGNYDVVATDDIDLVNASDSLKVGASISLDVEEGPAGTIITVSGRGFINAGLINDTDVTWAGIPISALSMLLDDEAWEVDDGDFSGDFVAPSYPKGTYEINVTDGVYYGTVDFEIDGVTVVEVDPSYGAPGAAITVRGYNFTQDANVDVEVTLNYSATVYVTAQTNADGTFEDVFQAPAIPFKNYKLTAVDEYGLNDTTGFKVGLIAMIINPTSGPSGTDVALTGIGFASGDYNMSFGDDEEYMDGTVVHEAIADNFFVPTIAPGVYDVSVTDSNENVLTTTFTVTDTTSLTPTPVNVAIGYNVSLYGEYYPEDAGATLTWYIWNSTWSDTIDPQFEGSDVTVGDEGNFTGYWVATEDLLLENSYYINATTTTANGNDLYAETMITIVEEEIEIWPNSLSYSLGEIITFTIKATFEKNSELEIMDPEGELIFFSTFAKADWEESDTWKVIRYWDQVIDGVQNPYLIPSDAMIGTWNWTLTDTDEDEIVASGEIEVLPTTAEQVDQRLSAVEGSLADLADDISGVTSELEDDIGDLASDIADVASEVDDLRDDIVSDLADDIAGAIDAADAAAEAVADLESTVSDIASVATDAKTAADSAAAAADDAATAAEDAKTAATGLTTLVYGAIGASLIAALAAIVSLMQISRKIA
jgi:hypothetical protein